ncbi:MAG: BlaI/MecI/CopY family transcriptional regulator [Rubripirellula sp.]|nr:BlaI/MecI/CopY family transcriptional regulator [Rubripirellula sp.]
MTAERLTNAELALMDLLWKEGPLTARQILEQLYTNTKTSQHGTVQRLLKSLEEKKFVDRDRSQGVQIFSSNICREMYGGQQLESLAEKLSDGSIAPLLTQLLDENKLDKTEIERLRSLLEKA